MTVIRWYSYYTFHFFFPCGSFPVFVFAYSRISLSIPLYNFFVVVTVHTFLMHTPLLMSTPVSALPVGNYGFVCVEFC
jgi:hypothetical protein